MKKIHRKRVLEWVEALESGEYEQARGALMHKGDAFDHFCCLGVACDLHAIHTGRGWHEKRRNRNYYMNNHGLLPIIVTEYFGLGLTAGIAFNTVSNGLVNLTGMNDDLEYNFKEISSIIRKYILGENIELSDKIKEALK